jgi:hypothetical protein
VHKGKYICILNIEQYRTLHMHMALHFLLPYDVSILFHIIIERCCRTQKNYCYNIILSQYEPSMCLSFSLFYLKRVKVDQDQSQTNDSGTNNV